MKKNRLTRVFAVVLTVAMCMGLAVPASAAGWNSRSSWSDFWDDVFDGWKNPWSGWDNPWWGNGNDDGKDDDANGDSSSDGDTKLTLIEDQSTVADGVKLRAATYLNEATGEITKPISVTLYDYKWNDVNVATRQLEAQKAYDAGKTSIASWDGIYFSSGNPLGYGLYNGIGNSTDFVVSDEIKYTGTRVRLTRNNYSTYGNGNYYYNNGSQYLQVEDIGRNGNTFNLYLKGSSNPVQVSNGSYVTLYTKESSNSITYTSGTYAGYNYWNKGKTDNLYGQYTYSGLVENMLDANKNIVFTKTEPGLFTQGDTDWKTVYNNVSIPFVYDESNKTYTFDSSQRTAHFTSTPASGATLTLEDCPQSNGIEYGDGSTTIWMPFNTETATTGTSTSKRILINGESNCNYHFGMQANIEFSMTPTGTLSSTNDTPIKFDFSGDDDVWVFIDGILVLDIGGIHNCLGGSIDFANNKWEIKKGEGNTNTTTVKDVNGKSLSGALFNNGTTTGVLGTDRVTFAADQRHTLTIYYLERGAGSSNCKIKFNLPMNDVLSVQKIVKDTDDQGAAIPAETMASINNKDFGFTLYKDGNTIANATYSVYAADGSFLTTASTDAKGHFTLKNGQSAKFIGDIDETNGNTYYVKEDPLDDTWVTESTQWKYNMRAASGTAEAQNAGTGLVSNPITVKGSAENADVLEFICTNVLKHQNDLTVAPNPDTIVIDYGLPVEIDVLANDAIIGGTGTLSIKESSWTGTYGNAAVENGKIVYTLNKQLSGVEVLTYTPVVTDAAGTPKDGNPTKVYIIPATTMYYEENFSNMVTFTGNWTNEGNASNQYQEPGVVGTTNDSPYGSDIAYKDDSGDSNGTSKYVNTQDGAAQFSYQFTGKGTSFFARTTLNSGYMRIVIKDSTNKTVHTSYRDTRFIDGTEVSKTLYNIPVFTSGDLGYGTYTVTVSIGGGAGIKGKDGNYAFGYEFWLDGIRVVNPMDSADSANYSVAESAYAADGESNMANVTLRQKMLKDYTKDENGELIWDDKNFVLFTDSNGRVVTASEYKSNGPKEEIYLAKNQSVTFSLIGWNPNTNRLYLGLKAPMGSGEVMIGNSTVNVTNAPDCYYDLSNTSYWTLTKQTIDGNEFDVATYTITNTKDNIISVTNIKVTGDTQFAIILNEDKNFDGDTGEGEDK